mmetsp:Transcript_19711/g.55673  ORF Transcript_19711/g.55673 Transcript_19711/m.55673 type:complete len:299 (+) Transcript_19711:237-1133(+)
MQGSHGCHFFARSLAGSHPLALLVGVGGGARLPVRRLQEDDGARPRLAQFTDEVGVALDVVDDIVAENDKVPDPESQHRREAFVVALVDRSRIGAQELLHDLDGGTAAGGSMQRRVAIHVLHGRLLSVPALQQGADDLHGGMGRRARDVERVHVGGADHARGLGIGAQESADHVHGGIVIAGHMEGRASLLADDLDLLGERGDALEGAHPIVRVDELHEDGVGVVEIDVPIAGLEVIGLISAVVVIIGGSRRSPPRCGGGRRNGHRLPLLLLWWGWRLSHWRRCCDPRLLLMHLHLLH